MKSQSLTIYSKCFSQNSLGALLARIPIIKVFLINYTWLSLGFMENIKWPMIYILHRCYYEAQHVSPEVSLYNLEKKNPES